MAEKPKADQKTEQKHRWHNKPKTYSGFSFSGVKKCWNYNSTYSFSGVKKCRNYNSRFSFSDMKKCRNYNAIVCTADPLLCDGVEDEPPDHVMVLKTDHQTI